MSSKNRQCSSEGEHVDGIEERRMKRFFESHSGRWKVAAVPRVFAPMWQMLSMLKTLGVSENEIRKVFGDIETSTLKGAIYSPNQVSQIIEFLRLQVNSAFKGPYLEWEGEVIYPKYFLRFKKALAKIAPNIVSEQFRYENGVPMGFGVHVYLENELPYQKLKDLIDNFGSKQRRKKGPLSGSGDLMETRFRQLQSRKPFLDLIMEHSNWNLLPEEVAMDIVLEGFFNMISSLEKVSSLYRDEKHIGKWGCESCQEVFFQRQRMFRWRERFESKMFIQGPKDGQPRVTTAL